MQRVPSASKRDCMVGRDSFARVALWHAINLSECLLLSSSPASSLLAATDMLPTPTPPSPPLKPLFRPPWEWAIRDRGREEGLTRPGGSTNLKGGQRCVCKSSLLLLRMYCMCVEGSTFIQNMARGRCCASLYSYAVVYCSTEDLKEGGNPTDRVQRWVVWILLKKRGSCFNFAAYHQGTQ